MADIKEHRQSLEERDFPILESMSDKMRLLVLDSFECTPIEESWPYRYKITENSFDFEWVFSAMGSVTLRVAKSERYRRNPPPIFYLSVGKYAGGYRWEDGDAVEIKFVKEEIVAKVKNMIHKFLESGGIF
jgi:hypothetical protein